VPSTVLRPPIAAVDECRTMHRQAKDE